MKNVIHDPDFGEIVFPSPPSKAEFEEVRRQVQETLRTRRLWPTGSVTRCPQCGEKAFLGRDDLSVSLPRPGGVLIFHHLRGAKCQACSAQSLEPADMVAVEDVAGVGTVADYEAKVTKIGSGTMGTYWPKDVVRVLHLSQGKRAFIQVLDRDTVLIRFKNPAREDQSRSGGKRDRKRARTTS